MPLKLVPPRPGKTPNWGIRGTYLRIAVDRSTGTPRKAVAARIKRDLERAIERGDYPAAPPQPVAPALTFLSAAVAYMRAGGSTRYLARLIEQIGTMALSEITQATVDGAAFALLPAASAATRNRAVYTPAAAVLHHAGLAIKINRPKGAKGRIVTDHLNPPEAAAVIDAARTIDPRFARLLAFLLYTGCRLGEALALRRSQIRLEERRAWIPTSKNGDPRELVLREDLARLLAEGIDPDVADDQRLFPFHQGGHLKHLLMRSKLAALGLPCPKRRVKGWRQPPNRLAFLNFHTFCHTWATWMRRYGGADLQGLIATRRWRDPKSAARYAHVVARAEWNRVEQLPAISGIIVERERDAG